LAKLAPAVKLVVVGLPVTQGNKTAYPFHKKDGKLGVAVREGKSGQRHSSWREAVAAEARKLAQNEPLDEPLVVEMTFYLPRPKSAKKNVRFPNKKPDSLKLARAVEDALTKILYADDARIVTHLIKKRFAVDSPPRVEIEVRPVSPFDV